ncbi:hypothetical protein MKW92_036391 [Papaver armeniacum]|nr:hypothetical protein MKW92_036391 [Papaver armeniacum]
MFKSHSSSFLQSLTILLIFGSSLVIDAVVVSPSKTFSYDLDARSFYRGSSEIEYSVSRSGNLALIDANGRIGWQTKTSNKGVVDIKLLPNGNLVLLDKNGGFVWQSFYYPTNTLLVGQGLGLGSSSTNKIVNGDYSMVLQGETLGLFFNPNPKSASASVKPFNYYNVTQMGKLVINITFDTSKFFFGEGSLNVLGIAISAGSSFMLAYPKYNSTLSMLRLGSNGNLYIYTYYELSAHGFIAWEETYAAFSREGRPSECLLPAKCLSFGLCKDNQCVACPTPKGLMGWDEKCKLPKVPDCNVSAAKLGYFKVRDVEDYRPLVNSDGEGPITVNDCMKKCTDDCKCVGFFYKNNDFKCFLAAQFNTLAKLDAVSKDSIDAYIKYAKNGGFVWQSFYHPTNTLLIGQGLGPGSSTTNKIVNGKYSMVLQDKTLRLFFNPNPKSLSSKPLTYYKVSPLMDLGVNIAFKTIIDPDYFDELIMFTGSGNGNNVWVEPYAAFSKKERSECFLPEKCGSYGLCEDHQCVACPTPKGLMGWDNKCKLPKVSSCNASTAANVGYYKVKDVEDYRPLGDSDGEGPMMVKECMKKCSDDSKCVGFFYRNDGSMCTLAAQFNTLAKLHAAFSGLIDAYIKYAK